MDEILARLDAADVPAGRIYSVADIVADPITRPARCLLDRAAGRRVVKMPGIVPKLSDTPGEVNGRVRRWGAYDEVLAGLGLEAAISRAAPQRSRAMTRIRQRTLIQEVAPRDGLQIEAKWVETERQNPADRSALGDRLQRIEAGSFVSRRRARRCATATDVFAASSGGPA